MGALNSPFLLSFCYIHFHKNTMSFAANGVLSLTTSISEDVIKWPTNTLFTNKLVSSSKINSNNLGVLNFTWNKSTGCPHYCIILILGSNQSCFSPTLLITLPLPSTSSLKSEPQNNPSFLTFSLPWGTLINQQVLLGLSTKCSMNLSYWHDPNPAHYH